MNQPTETPRQYILRRGAADGALLGAMFTATFYCSVYCERLPALGIAAMVMMAAVPFAAYMMLRRSYLEAHFPMHFAAVWLQGIMTFICGAMVTTVGVYLFFRYLEPHYMERTLNSYLAICDQRHIDDGLTRTLRRMSELKFYPKPVDMVMSTMWAISFSGSMLSLLLTPLVRLSKRR